MSYPEPRYLGETGEVNSWFRKADAAPDLLMRNGSASYLTTGESTGGKLGLYRWDMNGPRSGPDPHFHRSIAEAFFVLKGTIQLYNGTEWVDGRPGDFLYVPEGGLHGFRNESGEFASMLLMFVPGAPREAYFENVGHVGEMSEEEAAAFYLEHDTFWV
jgi:mannose-6-phosphate isomerase-like protein (cupin superfamily)